MEVSEHIREAHRQLTLAVAKFPKQARTHYIPAWIHWYTVSVKAMLKVGDLADKMERPHMKRNKK